MIKEARKEVTSQHRNESTGFSEILVKTRSHIPQLFPATSAKYGFFSPFPVLRPISAWLRSKEVTYSSKIVALNWKRKGKSEFLLSNLRTTLERAEANVRINSFLFLPYR